MVLFHEQNVLVILRCLDYPVPYAPHQQKAEGPSEEEELTRKEWSQTPETRHMTVFRVAWAELSFI